MCPEGLGLCSVTVMFRTTCFAYNRARLREVYPSPRAFFDIFAETIAEVQEEMTWQLPSLHECLAAFAEIRKDGGPAEHSEAAALVVPAFSAEPAAPPSKRERPAKAAGEAKPVAKRGRR